MSRRFAYALVHEGVLVLGDPDPRGNHLRLTPSGISFYTSADPDRATVLPWESIRSITAMPPLARFRPPAWISLAAAAVSASIGFDWVPRVADIEFRVVLRETAEDHTRVCSGFITRGYRRSHCDAIQTALRLLIKDERARALLADPERFLANIARIAGE
ncbi:hypothetical protein [Lysinibacter sp. HNR]|uniref:hypothetical protein n=1 Tax=Lysinibacter sp. HNR TaxID=3031408 RepID=UPI00243610E7|nr:hypothetical protein [Lysinibacter sp. HNR]WGD37467.1 hypothetical protein FrondiHNR_00660 [Lysinibacter sp. HNR]